MFCDSKGTYNSLLSLGIEKDKVSIIGNIITNPLKNKNIRRLLNLPLHSKIIAIIGWVRPIKRVENFIKIAQKFNDKNLCFLIIGKSGGNFKLDNYKDKLDNIIKNKSNSCSIKFAGHIKDISLYFGSIDILIHCCEKEAFGRVIAESLISKTPVIAADSYATKDLVIDNQTGYIVDYSNIDQYVKHIEILLNDDTLKSKLGKSGQKFIQKNFSPKSICKKLKYNYEDLI